MTSKVNGLVVARSLALLVICVAVQPAFPSSSQQHKRSRSDRDISAIGHRDVAYPGNWYSIEKEQEIAVKLSSALEQSTPLLHDKIADAYLNRLLEVLRNSSDAKMPVTLRVIDTDEVYAGTLPGGHQYITRGMLLKVQNEAELASALARGIAHTALRSAASEQSRASMLQMMTIPLILRTGGYEAKAGADLAVPMQMLKFRREQELDADYYGIQYVYKAGYDAANFVRFVGEVWPWPPPGLPGTAFSAFPPTPERLKALEKESSEILPKRDGAIANTPEFTKFQEHLLTLEPPKRTIEHPTSITSH